MNRVTIRYAAMSRQIAEESSTRVSLPGSFAGTQSVGHTPASFDGEGKPREDQYKHESLKRLRTVSHVSIVTRD